MARLSVGIKDVSSSLCLLAMLLASIALGADGQHDGSSPVKASAPTSSQAIPARPLSPSSSQGPQTRMVKNYGNLPISFEANQGQTDSEVRFLSRGKGYTLFLTPAEAVLALSNPAASDPGLSGGAPGHSSVNTVQHKGVLRAGGHELGGRS